MSLLSVIIPCYNEEAAVPFFYDAMQKTADDFADRFPGVEFEYIFIDDGSTDKTMDVIKRLRDKDKRVHFLSFSRNFGKEAALYAGFSKAAGDYVVCMDADLQDPPELLADMYSAIVFEIHRRNTWINGEHLEGIQLELCHTSVSCLYALSSCRHNASSKHPGKIFEITAGQERSKVR